MSTPSPEPQPGHASVPVAGSNSEALFTRATAMMPGGVNSPVRAMRSIGREYPVFIERGEGAELIDADGNRYVDWVCSWGPLILGHAYPPIVEAVEAAAARGTSFGAPTSAETELAIQIAERMPSVEMVRMVNSGTEAAMSVVRLARAATGRDAVLKFSGAYHGHVDGLLAEAGSGLATQGIPASPGVTAAQAADTVIVPWNDPDALHEVLAEREVAAILAEPIPANMGLVPAQPGFLEILREAADDHGALLVFDEVISGFRVARGGAQELLGVVPDVTVMGKVIGGGLPAAAYGASRELMERVAPAGDVYQAGTLSGNPLAVAAGLATLRHLDSDAYARLGELTELLASGLRDAAAGRAVQVVSVPGLVTPFFTDVTPIDFAGSKACDHDAYGAFARGMLDRGFYPPASQYEAWFVSLAHDELAIERTCEAAAEVLGEVLGPAA